MKDWRSKLPYIVAVVLYAALSYGYFSPQISGEILYQHDVKQYEGMTQDILESREATGVDPQWTGSMFSGMPAYLINVAYPAQIIKIAFNRTLAAAGTPAAFIFFAMLSMFLMLIMMGFNGWIAVVGGVMYGLSTYFFLIIEAGHITKMWALVYAPLMFGGVYMALRGKMLWGAALAALFASAQIGANHPQISYYFALAIAAFWLSELYFAVRESRIADFAKRTGLLVVAAVLAVVSNLSPLWYTFEHTPDTMRGGSELVEASGGQGLDLAYATAWSYGTTESLNMLVPNFVGGSSFDGFSDSGAVAKSLAPYGLVEFIDYLPTYWGPQGFTGGPTYIGAVVIFLAILALCVARGREKWWILAICIFMIMLSWGRHFMWFTELMFNILPGYNKFRTVSMTLVVVQWCMPLLAVVSLSKLYRGEFDRDLFTRRLLTVTASIGALLLLFIVAGGAIFSFGGDESFRLLVQSYRFPEQIAIEVARAIEIERFEIMRSDALRSLGLILLCSATLFFAARKRLSSAVMLIVVGLLVVVDMLPVNLRYLNSEDFISPREARIYPSAIDREILEDEDLGYRVLNLTVSPFNDATTSYFHRSVGGYHGAKLARYQDIIDTYMGSQIDEQILMMLNTRYIISSDESRQAVLIENDDAFGAAWFTEHLFLVDDPHAEIEAIGMLDLERLSVADRSFSPMLTGSLYQSDQPQGLGQGLIELVEYEPNYLRYDYSLDKAGVAIFSEIYYPKGWRAYIDGEEAPYFRANYILRAMELPAGEHTVEWRFRAPRWALVEGITLAASLIIILSILYLLIRMIYERRQKIKA